MYIEEEEEEEDSFFLEHTKKWKSPWNKLSCSFTLYN